MMSRAKPRSVAEVDSFITMLLAACADRKMNDRLERLLSLPDEKRRGEVHALVTDLLIAEAPQDLVRALACLLDDAVAEKAYEVIFQCKRRM